MRKTKTTPTKADLPDAVLLGQERSRLFWLLYEHHAVLATRWRGRRVDWRAVCAWAIAEGGMNAKGEPPTPNLAKQTWRRVCDLHAREKADREAKQRPAYARSPATSQPPPVAAPSPNRSHPPPAQGAASAEDVVDELNAFIRRRSGRS
jgi:hypothetical protein